MRIDKIENTSFKKIYRLKNTPENLDALQNKIIPIYETISKEPAFVFLGSNPFKGGLDAIIKGLAQAHNVTRKWLKRKAEEYGLDYTSSNDGIMHVVTTKKDIDEMMNYMDYRLALRLLETKKTFLDSSTTKNKKDKTVPPYIDALRAALEIDKAEEDAFSKYPKKIVEVNSVEELFSKMMNER